MCQEQVIRYLEKKKGQPVDINELLRVIPSNRGNISRACRTMVEHREIKIQKVREGPFTRFLFSV